MSFCGIGVNSFRHVAMPVDTDCEGRREGALTGNLKMDGVC
ncbi:hypothetical protein ART_0729 [Arthrobacter sp. PAMC 25486]|nr:hypothetical protein ART_0729 [Arthrobacter sp. PAMC 25486]